MPLNKKRSIHLLDVLKKFTSSNVKFNATELGTQLQTEYPQYKKNIIKDTLKTILQLSAEINNKDERNFLVKLDKNIKIEKLKIETARKQNYFWYEAYNKPHDNILTKNEKINESALYDKLSEYLTSLKLYTQRIDEKTSSNTKGKNANKWLLLILLHCKKLVLVGRKTLYNVQSIALHHLSVFYLLKLR